METTEVKEKPYACPYCRRKEGVIKSGLNPTGAHPYKFRSCVRAEVKNNKDVVHKRANLLAPHYAC